jgi:hypothetical protein
MDEAKDHQIDRASSSIRRNALSYGDARREFSPLFAAAGKHFGS